MPLWLDTRGNSVLSIAICDRCKRKVAYSDIRPDGNIPGIRVCGDGCSDQFDPYRLPARQSERISLRFPRPDADIVNDPTPYDLTGTPGEFGIAPETSEDDIDGNLDNLSP